MSDWRRAAARFERSLVPPLHPEAWRVIPFFAVASLVLFWIWTPLGWVGVALTVWAATLFREPARTPPAPEALAVSPIDGTITEIGSAPPPVGLEMDDGDRVYLSVAFGPWDSHVARAPAEGRLTKFVHDYPAPGRINRGGERLAARIETDGGAIALVLAAEGLGRRARGDTVEGQAVRLGDRLGTVLFAGRVEIYLPAGAVPRVVTGQRMVAGETVLAEPAPPPR